MHRVDRVELRGSYQQGSQQQQCFNVGENFWKFNEKRIKGENEEKEIKKWDKKEQLIKGSSEEREQ